MEPVEAVQKIYQSNTCRKILSWLKFYDEPRVQVIKTLSDLTGKTLAATKIEILKYGLKHGLATCPSEVELIIIAENTRDHIEQKGLCNHFMK